MRKILILTATLCFVYSLILPSCSDNKKEISDADSAESELADSTGLPGDNLSLFAVMELFKGSANPEDFEKKLNTAKNVNNLDLNQDKKSDYIRVKDEISGSAHAIILQALINESEYQDIAVLSLVKRQNGVITLQIRGNEYLYGENAIVEPKAGGDETLKKASFFPDIVYPASVEVFVNVSPWAPVAYIYRPAYVVWVSPVVWETYPEWYSPWRPYPYGWYRREIAHHKKGYIYRDVFYPNPAFVTYYPGRQNSIFVINSYDKLYKKKGWPKMKGKPFYGPGSPNKFHNKTHFGDHWDHGHKDYYKTGSKNAPDHSRNEPAKMKRDKQSSQNHNKPAPERKKHQAPGGHSKGGGGGKDKGQGKRNK